MSGHEEAVSMRVGIVGAGSVFIAHASAYQALGVTIQGVADVDRARAQAAAAYHRIPIASDDWQELIDRNDVDVVDVCTPPQFHTPVVLAALAAGKHVICEKPLAANLEEADRIVEACEKAPGMLTVVHQMRLHPAYQRLKWLVHEGHLGPICLGRVVRYDPPPASLVARGLWGDWRLVGGGVVMTKAIHQLDLILWLLGDARRVQAMMGTYLFPIESEDEAIVNIELASGALVSLCISGCPYGNKEHFDLIGERGAAGFPWHMRLRDASAQQRIEAELDKRFALPSPWKHKLDAFLSRQRWTRRLPPEVKYHEWFLGPFLDAIQGRGSNPVSALEARKAVELCTAIYTAALTGEPADLPLDSTTRFYRGVPKDDYVVAGRARSYGQS